MAMKFTKQNIKRINQEAKADNDGLTESVTDYIIDKWDEYDDKKNIVTDVLEHGCQSGIVGSLIYYDDTTAYYETNKNAINELLYETMDECGIYDLSKLFGDKWDKEDPLAIDVLNQNLLAWFGFEETMRKVAREFEELEELV